MNFEETAVRLWKRLEREEKIAAAERFFAEPPQEVYGSALGAIVKARHLRPQVARSMSPEEQGRALASVLDPGEPVAAVNAVLEKSVPEMNRMLGERGVGRIDGGKPIP